jgi:hypothetical protein
MNRNVPRRDEGIAMKKLLGVVALFLLPLAADAQTVQRIPGPEPGITVQGRGSVKVPVKSLAFSAMARGNIDEAGALAALRAAGVVDPSMGPLGTNFSASNAMSVLRGTVPVASEAKLEKIGLAAMDYGKQHPGITVENISFAPRFEDCPATEEAARTAAFAEARRRAQAIATLAGLTIEGVTAVSENGGCPVSDGQPFAGPGQGLDLGTLTATIAVNESVTFAVAPANGARRQPL